MSVDEAVLDYDPIGEFEQDDRRMLRMLLVAAQRVMVDQIVSAVSAAKLEPLGLDLVPVRARARRRDARRDARPRGGRRGGRDRRRLARHQHRGPRARHDAVRPDPALGRARHHRRRSRAPRGSRTRPRSGSSAVSSSRTSPTDRAPRTSATSRCSAPGRSSTRSDPRSSSTRRRRVTRGSAACSITGGGSRLEGLLDLMRQRIPVPVDTGRVFEHVPSQLALSEAATAEAEPGARDRGGPRDRGEGGVSQVNLLPPEILQRQGQRTAHDLRDRGGARRSSASILAFYLLQVNRLAGVNDDIEAQERTNAVDRARDRRRCSSTRTSRSRRTRRSRRCATPTRARCRSRRR